MPRVHTKIGSNLLAFHCMRVHVKNILQKNTLVENLSALYWINPLIEISLDLGSQKSLHTNTIVRMNLTPTYNLLQQKIMYKLNLRLKLTSGCNNTYEKNLRMQFYSLKLRILQV